MNNDYLDLEIIITVGEYIRSFGNSLTPKAKNTYRSSFNNLKRVKDLLQAHNYYNMKFITVVLLAISIPFAKCYCQKTQTQLSNQYGNIALDSKKKMDSVYHLILKLYAGDTLFVKNLKLSQVAWLRYFTAEERAMFPEYPTGHYGSMLSMCASQLASRLISERIGELQAWLNGSDNGDCASSIKPKDELFSNKN